MAEDLTIQFRRVGDRGTGPFSRMRPVYEIVVLDEGREKYRAVTTTPSSALVIEGRVHTTDSWDWIQAADDAYAHHDQAWISDPFPA